MKSYKDIAGDGGSNIVEQVTARAAKLQARLADVKKIIAVMSGKGGVGKSSVTINLATAFASKGMRIGILDADINGPSIARMTGVQGQQLQTSPQGMQPAIGPLGVKVMSMDLFLPDAGAPVVWKAPTQRDSFTWRGMMEAAALQDLIGDTEWGSLDVLLIDLPPGTDKLPHLIDLLPRMHGTLVVTIPSEASKFIVGKSIYMAQQVLRAPVLGLIENMAGYCCPHCGRESALYPDGQIDRLAQQHDIPLLARIPFDPQVAVATDGGAPIVASSPKHRIARIFGALAQDVMKALEQREQMQSTVEGDAE